MITVQIDSFKECQKELAEIFITHWHELALFKDKMPLAPQYLEYVAREKDGVLFLTTVRVDGKLAAYYIAQVRPGFHYGSTLTGTMDILYVVPEFRGRGLAFPLFRYVERELRRRGVKVWYSGYKIHNPLGLDKLYDAFGFIDADIYKVKWIGE